MNQAMKKIKAEAVFQQGLALPPQLGPKRFKKPLLHFLVLGLLLFAVDQWREVRESYRIIEPDAATIDRAAQQLQQLQGAVPTAAQRAGLREREIDQRLLFAEALRRKLHLSDSVAYQRLLLNAEFLGLQGDAKEQLKAALALDLHRGDEVIRRRLIQRMEELGRHSQPIAEPSRAQLEALYVQSPERWRQRPMYSFNHVFISRDKPEMQGRAAHIASGLRRGEYSFEQAMALGDRFLLGHRLPLLSTRGVEQNFGPGFVEQLQAQADEEGMSAAWLGPLVSSYGLHMVEMIDYRAARYRSVDEVMTTLRDEYLRAERERALAEFVSELRQKYEVIAP